MGVTYKIFLYYKQNNKFEFCKTMIAALINAGFTTHYIDPDSAENLGPVGLTKEEAISKYKTQCWTSINNESLDYTIGNYFYVSEWDFLVYGRWHFDGVHTRVVMGVDDNYFTNTTQASLVETVKKIIRATKPLYVFIDDDIYLGDFMCQQEMFEVEYLKDNKLVDFNYWFNYLGPDLVKAYGRERLYNGPFYKVEDIGTDGLFIQLNPEVVGNYRPQRTREEAIKYLNIDTSWKNKP